MLAVTPGKVMRQVTHVNLPKNILRLWLWRAPKDSKAVPITGKGRQFLEASENSKESLLAGELSDSGRAGLTPEEVPKGFLAVYVGPEQRRFVIPMSCLSMPEFRVLMDRVAEEFGFEQQGGLQIPCEEQDFEDILFRCLRMHKMTSKSKNKTSKMRIPVCHHQGV